MRTTRIACVLAQHRRFVNRAAIVVFLTSSCSVDHLFHFFNATHLRRRSGIIAALIIASVQKTAESDVNAWHRYFM